MNPSSEIPSCTLYRVINGSPSANMIQLIEIMGGIESIISPDDIVLIKPNVQWWNQGSPNLCALKTFIDLIMNRPGGFHGEVIIGENCHRGPQPWMSQDSGWAHIFERNADIDSIHNLNDLTSHLKKMYGDRFSGVHFVDVQAGARRIFGPSEGAGYVYCDGTGGVPLLKYDNCATGSAFRQVIMTYPIFTTDRGTTVDFKHGIWAKGAYTGQLLKFINFAALNHHSSYCGTTSAIKNYLGITDLSGGPDPENMGKIISRYYNFHSFPFNKWSSGPVPGMLGGEVGTFMNIVRKADMNITTAQWAGLASRTDLPAAHTKAVFACSDPVALDYHTAKYILYPNSRISVHNPDNTAGPLYDDLKKCADITGFQFDERRVTVKSYDSNQHILTESSGSKIIGNIKWGGDLKAILKYLYLRIT
ncbi:MAG: DUF362 domain-containing protein [Deltaproteobacteria bacterium]|nr:DUF362 domain-containing protein [Deltaproteobacteria bacterium]